MSCNLEHDQLLLFLGGALPAAAAAQVALHLETCPTCQAEPLLPPEFAGLLRQKLPPAPAANPAFSRRLRSAFGTGAAPGPAAAVPGAGGAAPWQRLLASPWTPRLAMVTVLACLVFLPVRSVLRAPALAEDSVQRHEAHARSFGGPVPRCCRDLHRGLGDRLEAPSAGAVVRDLRGAGLELVMVSQCGGGTPVNQICYRSGSGALFSLYISDGLAEKFQALHLRSEGGLRHARFRVHDSAVALWERRGLVYEWVGPHGSTEYDRALGLLQRLE